MLFIYNTEKARLNTFLIIDLKRCSRKMKEYRLLIATILTSTCCVYKETIVKNVSYQRTKRSYKLRKLEHTTWIVKKSNQYQTNNLDIKSYSHYYFSTHLYIVDIS